MGDNEHPKIHNSQNIVFFFEIEKLRIFFWGEYQVLMCVYLYTYRVILMCVLSRSL